MTEHEVEAALRDLATRLDVPEPPDVTAAVLSRISVPPRRRGRFLAAFLAALAAFAVAVTVSPAVRAGVVEILEFAGIEFRSEPPPNAPVRDPLERAVSLEEARRTAPFEIHLPAALGEPKEVLVENGRVVSLVYDGMRLDEFDGALSPVMAKIIGADGVEQVTVGGVDGLWVGKPHAVYYIDENGQHWSQGPRLAGSTLIWQRDGVTLRLEGDLTKEAALAIATG